MKVDMQHVLDKGASVKQGENQYTLRDKDQRCAKFIDKLKVNSAYFNYKKRQLPLPGDNQKTAKQKIQENYENLKKTVE